MSNIKTFDQYLEEMHHQDEQFPDEFFDVIGDSKAAQMLVSLTKTVHTDSPSTTGRSVYDTLMKECQMFLLNFRMSYLYLVKRNRQCAISSK